MKFAEENKGPVAECFCSLVCIQILESQLRSSVTRLLFSLCTDPNFDASIIPMTQQLLLFVLEGEIGPDLSLMLNLKPIQICRRQRKGQGSGSWGRIMHPKLCIS